MQEILENEDQKELLAQRDEMATRAREEGRRERLRCRAALPMEECKNALEMDPGEYVVTRYAETTRTVLFISPIDEETPIWGAFLQEEIERIGPLASQKGVCIAGLGVRKQSKQ